MRLSSFARPRSLLLLAMPLAIFGANLRTSDSVQAPAAIAQELVVAAPAAPALASPPEQPAAPLLQQPEPTAAPTLGPPEVTPSATVEPTPTPRAADAPLRVGIQVGHWKSNELPDELQRLRGSTGTSAGGFTETQVNLDVAQRVVALLQAEGVLADLLPATVPPGYLADAFVAIHADGSASAKARGFKLATPWRTSPAAQHLLDVLRAEYGAATKQPYDSGGITTNMRGYYAFSWRRHEHAVAKTTPAVILEMGFLTNPGDRALMTTRQDLLAGAIARGIMRYLGEHDPNDGASLLPPDLRNQRPATDGVAIRVAPADDARIVMRVNTDRRLFPIQERDGWYQVFVRGQSNTMGWVRKDQLVETTDPTPTPPPATDS